jgi:phospholipid/cholesterol/gamma-HCH transport system substrate-binding protein
MAQNPSAAASPVAYLEFRVAALLLLMLLLVSGSVLYVMYARGVFEPTQQLVLMADDSEGVKVGMDLTFSGFPVGRVRRIELDPDGNARIVIDVPQKDAHWLRQSSVFTLVRGILGNTSIRAYSGILTDPPLLDGAVRKVLVGDATAEIPHLVSAARDLVQSLTALTGPDSPLAASLANVQAATEKLKGQTGALGVLFGNEKDARKLVAALDRTNALLARVDDIAAHADTQVFGSDGAVSQSRAAIAQLDAALGDARATLKKLDGVLQEAQGVASNVRGATNDLGALRAEVEVSLRKVEYLVDEVNRKWPFARDTELKLP